jgi:YHS domain-containing protein
MYEMGDYMKYFLSVLTIFFISSSFVLSDVQSANAKPQTVCPVMGDAINKNIYTDYQGSRIYFCCDGCPQEFKKNPRKYMKVLKDSGVTLEKTPVKEKSNAPGKSSDDHSKHKHGQ